MNRRLVPPIAAVLLVVWLVVPGEVPGIVAFILLVTLAVWGRRG